MSHILEQIIDRYPDESFLKEDGFDEAIIGVDEASMRLVYSVSKCISIIEFDQNMTRTEAIEYFEFNVRGAYVGEKTPIWCEDNFDL
jgi:hypothetical protein